MFYYRLLQKTGIRFGSCASCRQMDEPMSVSVPCLSIRLPSSRELVVKIWSVNSMATKQKWMELASKEITFEDIQVGNNS